MCISFQLVWPKLTSLPQNIVLKASKPRWKSDFCLLCHVPAYHHDQASWKDFVFLNHIFQPQPASQKRQNNLSPLQFLEFLLATDSLFVLVSPLHYSSLMQHSLPRIWHESNQSCKRSFLGPANPTENVNSTQKWEEWKCRQYRSCYLALFHHLAHWL